jgi:hypothetical protein
MASSIRRQQRQERGWLAVCHRLLCQFHQGLPVAPGHRPVHAHAPGVRVDAGQDLHQPLPHPGFLPPRLVQAEVQGGHHPPLHRPGPPADQGDGLLGVPDPQAVALQGLPQLGERFPRFEYISHHVHAALFEAEAVDAGDQGPVPLVGFQRLPQLLHLSAQRHVGLLAPLRPAVDLLRLPPVVGLARKDDAQDGAQAEDVTTLVQPAYLAAGLLRRHVGERAQDRPGPG